MKSSNRRHPAARAAAAVTAGAALLLGTWAGPAHAHGGQVEFTVEAHDTELHVHAVWEDGDAIEDADAVTAVVDGGQPANLEHTEGGTYSGDMGDVAAGDHEVLVTLFHADAEGGQAEVTETVTVGDGAGGGGATETTEATGTGSASEPAEDAGATAPDTEEAADEDDDSGGSMVLIIILVVVVLAVIGAVIWAVKGRGQDEDE